MAVKFMAWANGHYNIMSRMDMYMYLCSHPLDIADCLSARPLSTKPTAKLQYDQLQGYITTKYKIALCLDNGSLRVRKALRLASLQYQENVGVPAADELGSNEVLVKIYAVSLNHREISIADPKVDKLP